MDKQKIVIIILAIGLVITVQYSLLDKWSISEQQQKILTFQQGYNQGLKDAVSALYKQTENCQQSTIAVGNITKTVIDIACLHKNPKP